MRAYAEALVTQRWKEKGPRWDAEVVATAAALAFNDAATTGKLHDTTRQALDRMWTVQREDGGWSLPSLGDWKRLDGTANDPKGPSDGYGTGLVIYILRQSGVPKDDKAIQRGVKWLKTNQRESGRWFTRSVNADRDHWITNAGTAFAVLAIKSCE